MSIFYGTILAVGLVSLRYFRTPATLRRRRVAFGLVTTSLLFDALYDLHCESRMNLYIHGQGQTPEHKSIGDIYAFYSLFRSPEMEGQLEAPDNLKERETVYSDSWKEINKLGEFPFLSFDVFK